MVEKGVYDESAGVTGKWMGNRTAQAGPGHQTSSSRKTVRKQQHKKAQEENQ
jgi:hypothetical protein